jgi:mannan endo-1,4-beta-mannosidase
MTATARTLIAALLAGLALLALPAAGASAKPDVRFGAWTPGSPFGGDLSATDALEQRIQRRVEIVHWFQDWGVDAQHFRWNVKKAVRSIRRSGRTPMLTWEPYKPGPWEAYRNRVIASGAYDRYIRFWARGLKRLKRPVYIRFAHEFNGDWYPWGGPVNDNSVSSFKRMWRHVVTVMRQAGARNVRWVWSPLVEGPKGKPNFSRYYPGHRYVDVLGLSGFNWGASTPEYGGWRSFREIFSKAYRRIRTLGPQPVWITEIGSASDGGDKHQWVRNMFKTSRRWDRLTTIVWYDQDKERDWSTASAASAFRD